MKNKVSNKTKVKTPCVKDCVECKNCKEKTEKEVVVKRPFTTEEAEIWRKFSDNTKEEYTKKDEAYILETIKIVNGIKLKSCVGCGANVWGFWIEKLNEELNKE